MIAASGELGVGDAIGVVGVYSDTLLLGVGAVVEKDAPARDAVVRPVVDGGLGVSVRTEDIFAMSIVIEGAGGDPCELRRVFSRLML